MQINIFWSKKTAKGVHRYKMAHFEGYFLGARAVLDIFFEFAPVMESRRKNEGAILYLLIQFKDLSNNFHMCKKCIYNKYFIQINYDIENFMVGLLCSSVREEREECLKIVRLIRKKTVCTAHQESLKYQSILTGQLIA